MTDAMHMLKFYEKVLQLWDASDSRNVEVHLTTNMLYYYDIHNMESDDICL